MPGQIGELFTDSDVLGWNRQQPALRRMTKDISCQGEDRRGIRRVGENPRRNRGSDGTKPNFAGSIDGCVHKYDSLGSSNRLGQLRREERAGQDSNARKIQRGHRFGDLRADAVVAPQCIAITNDQHLSRCAANYDAARAKLQDVLRISDFNAETLCLSNLCAA